MKCIDCQHRSLSHIEGECFGRMTGSFIDGSQKAVCQCKRFNRGKRKLPKFTIQYADYDQKIVLKNQQGKQFSVNLSSYEYEKVKGFLQGQSPNGR